jgi:poly [ADP-ribose] polymerase
MGKKKAKKKDSEDDTKSDISKVEKKKGKNKKSKKSKKDPEVKDVTPVVKVVDKKAIVDQYFPNRNQYHIYPDDENDFNGQFFSCTLNKSDLDNNNNKFYIIQLLENDSDNSLILFTRWGRIGVPGQHEEKSVDSKSGPR